MGDLAGPLCCLLGTAAADDSVIGTERASLWTPGRHLVHHWLAPLRCPCAHCRRLAQPATDSAHDKFPSCTNLVIFDEVRETKKDEEQIPPSFSPEKKANIIEACRVKLDQM